MTKNLTKKQLQSYNDAFHVFDKNGDGTISCDELGSVMKSMGMKCTEQDIKNMIRNVDKDKDEAVDFNEFCAMMVKMEGGRTSKAMGLHEAFRIFDRDDSGFISRVELMAVLTAVGQPKTEAEIDGIIKEFDKDRNGRIDYKEFESIFKSGKK